MSCVANAADLLAAAVRQAGAPLCVGIDPVVERLPAAIRREPAAAAVGIFSRGVLDATAGIAAAAKFQSACFERYGWEGMRELEACCRHARDLGIIIVLDAKRGDIGISAAHYAAAARDRFGADWTTVSPYLGTEGIEPFLGEGRGAFVLVRTSNPSGDQLQSMRLERGGTVAEAVTGVLDAAGGAITGQCGYSTLGAVVGATKGAELASLRARMTNRWLLVPGYGAQGGRLEDVLPCIDAEGLGVLLTASRSILYPAGAEGQGWQESVAAAARALREEIRSGLQTRVAARPA